MNMKTKIYILLCCVIALAGCDYDNYEAPKSQLRGRIVYDEESVGLRQTGTGQDYNVLELYQPGFEGTAPIPVYVAQDGSFSAMLFDGTYRMVAKNGSGPWVDSGTELWFDVRGNTVVDFPVTPYYVIRDARFNTGDGKLTVSFRIARGAFTLINGKPDALLESIALYINNTQFVDDATFRKKVDAASLTLGSQSITVNLQDAELQKYPVLYARIGVGTQGVTPKIYTPGSVRVK